MKTCVVLAAVLLLLSQSPPSCCTNHEGCVNNGHGSHDAPPSDDGLTDFTVEVRNQIQNSPPNTYQAKVAPFGILIGALNRLLYTQEFHFTYIADPNYGPYLQSVNRVSASLQDRTYWSLLSKKAGCDFTPLTVGIGCYQPQQHEIILLNFTTY